MRWNWLLAVVLAAGLWMAACESSETPGVSCTPNPCTTEHRTVCQVDGEQAHCSCDADYHENTQGVCVAQSVCEPACPSGQHCEQGVCLDDVCSPACGALQRCVAGVCQDLPCEPACAAGTHCQGGTCVEDDCLPACPAGQHCQAGQCQDNVCDPVCPAGETCLDPAARTCACGANPSCPANQRCVDGACQVNDRCIDGADNDQDGWTDAADPDCLYGTDEVGFGTTSCNDGLDNDSESFSDAADPGCSSAVADEGSAPWTYVPASLSSCLLDMACPRVAIESHMGDWSLSIPGNSMAAFEKAFQDGAQAIESDIRVSADGVPFMIHNDQITAYESVLCAGKVVSQSPRLWRSPTACWPHRSPKRSRPSTSSWSGPGARS